MIHRDDLYICLPAYNESGVIGKVIGDLMDAGYRHVCVVDDGSSDATAAVARRAGAIVLPHPINLGAGAAVMTAITAARLRGWNHILLMDADGQHCTEDVGNLIAKQAEAGADIVIGSRFLAPVDGIPRSRRFFNWVGNAMTNLFCHHRYSDTQSGLRLLDRRAIHLLNLRLNGFGFCSEMIHQAEAADLSIAEAPISVRYTDYSRSKGQDLPMGFTTALTFIWNVVFR